MFLFEQASLIESPHSFLEAPSARLVVAPMRAGNGYPRDNRQIPGQERDAELNAELRAHASTFSSARAACQAPK